MNHAEVTQGVILILPLLDHPKLSCTSPGRLYTTELTLARLELAIFGSNTNVLSIRPQG